MPTFLLNKLVRDELPSLYEGLGQQAEVKVLEGEEHIAALLAKLDEEYGEFNPSHETTEIPGEIIDVLEVIESLEKRGIEDERFDAMRSEFAQIAGVIGLSSEDIQTLLEQKRTSKGSFDAGYWIGRLVLSDDDTYWVEYYRKEPERFPEVA